MISLVLPWFEVLGKPRSSIDIVASAGVLNVIDGGVQLLILAGWLVAPLLVSIAMFLAASGRHGRAALLLAPIGIVFVSVFIIGVFVDEIGIAWGVNFGAACGAITTVLSVVALVRTRAAEVGSSTA